MALEIGLYLRYIPLLPRPKRQQLVIRFTTGSLFTVNATINQTIIHAEFQLSHVVDRQIVPIGQFRVRLKVFVGQSTKLNLFRWWYFEQSHRGQREGLDHLLFYLKYC